MAHRTSPEEVDEVISRLQQALLDLDLAQGSVVKLRGAEIAILKILEEVRDILAYLLSHPAPGRTVLLSIFGGDCVRIGTSRAYHLVTS